MEKEFIPYEQALALKELGFDEPCFAQWNDSNVFDVFGGNYKNSHFNKPDQVALPLYQQAFRWFREKGIDSEFKKIEEGYAFHGFKNQEELGESLLKLFSDDREKYVFNTYEEAELECLKKLIEIVKNDR